MGERAIILLGAGGHAKVVLESAIAADTPVRGFYDDANQPALLALPDPPEHLGPLGEALEHPPILRAARPFIALGELNTRRSIIDRLGERTRYAPALIHPSSVVSASARLARGVLVAPGAVINAHARIGPHAIINTGAIIEHDATIGANAHIAPRAAIAGGASVGADTLVGMGACILPGVTVGARCTVGAGAVVMSDVPDAETVVGVPARVIARN